MTASKPAVGWIGLGAMGSGMAASLVSQGFKVKAYDVYPPSLEAVAKAGATPFKTPAEAATNVQVLGLMVVNAYQVDDVLFGAGRVAEVLEDGASIICFSTVPPSFLVTVKERLDALGKNIGLCDSPVSGGSTRAASGELAIMTSGTPSSISTAGPVFDALTRQPVGALTVVGDKVGLASDFKLINQVFCAVQIASQAEALALAKNMGLNPRLVYNLIKGASGDSFMFGHRGPWSLNHDGVPKSAMTIISKDIGIVMDEAREHTFPAPVCAVAEQLFTAAIGAGLVREDDGLVSKLWERFGGQPIAETGTVEDEEEKAKELDITPNQKAGKVLFVGLGAMGGPMATALHKAGIDVTGFDLTLEAMDRFSAQGGKVTSDAVQAAKDVDTVLLVTVTALQAEAALFGAEGASGISSALPEGSTVILCSTIAPADAVKLQGLLDKQQKGLQLVDAPISGGPSRSATGDLTIMASGSNEALSKASIVLQALSGQAGNKSNLHFIPGGVGNGSKVKAVNQLLAGIHLAVAAEGFAFAKRKGMDLQTVFGVVSKGAASSYMMLDRVPRMFKREEATVHSATSTFVKDLSIVLAEAKRCNTPLFLGQAALQQFTIACANGLANEDDSSLGRLWENMGVILKSQT
ncbi:hypothetical protein IAR55_006264 [Kwoniella newhampshirensis]|uniref:3-hydroxyisobutyrate dehydrogenase n=1 Tax=Kwoniella newhampshirensis TaxID=1651941 RepID=A0AAW0YV26_9TREE